MLQRPDQLRIDENTIDCDLSRTVQLTEYPELMPVLRNMLRCYCCVEGSKGYYQGMNSVAAVMLWLVDFSGAHELNDYLCSALGGDESIAFWCFRKLIQTHMPAFDADFPLGKSLLLLTD